MADRKDMEIVSRTQRRAPATVKAAILLLCLLALIAAAPPLTGSRLVDDITAALFQGPHAGDCTQCHSQHADGEPAPLAKLLLGPNDNTLCETCHLTPWSGGSYAGPLLFSGSPHGYSSDMIWPGPDPPARVEADAANKCVNCHDPHGRVDGTGEVPALLHLREEETCFTCHDGHPAQADIRSDFLKPFRHPATDFTDRHAGATESLPEDFAITPIDKRHAECEDCHNTHVSRPDGLLPPSPPDASKLTLGVSRVRAIYGAAGTIPSYAFTAGADTSTAPVTESQLCFKCHSSWTTQPVGQTDIARVVNPNNPSYHPIEALGKNLNIDPAAFVSPWTATSYTRCDDCHGTDFGSTRGPHGSAFDNILRADYVASPNWRTVSSDELCFDCHTFSVYGGRDAGSRFGPHYRHISRRGIGCYSCHASHGSTTDPHLIFEGRDPGIQSYTETPTGGSCTGTPACHGTKTYTVEYAR